MIKVISEWDIGLEDTIFNSLDVAEEFVKSEFEDWVADDVGMTYEEAIKENLIKFKEIRVQ